MWTSAYGGPAIPLTTAYNLKPHKTYAIGVLFVGTTAPRIMGKTGLSGLELLRPNALCGSVAGQTDVPATVAVASISAASGSFVYARLDTA